MGIYDKGINFDFDFSYEKLKGPIMVVAALVAAAIIVIAGMSIYAALQPKAIEFSFEKNPVSSNEQTHLVVIVRNTTPIDAEHVTVRASAKLSSKIQVNNVEENYFSIIESGKWRQVTFLVNPVENVSSGTYEIIVSTKINDLNISETAVLEIE